MTLGERLQFTDRLLLISPNTRISRIIPRRPVDSNHNEPPTEQTASLIHKHLSHLHHDIGALEDEILSTTAYLERCRALLDSFRSSEAKLNGCISALHRFPFELLSEVFKWCPSHTLDLSQTPWTLTLVCRKWRTVALATPQIWASVSLQWSGLRKAPSVGMVNGLVKTCMLRSANVLLNIVLDLDALTGLNEHHPALDLLLPHSARWNSLSVVLCIRSFHELAPVKGNLPNLRSLNVLFRGYYHDDMPLVDFFDVAPRLREIQSVNMLGSIRLPYSGMRYIDGGAASLSQLYDALSAARNVVYLAFDSSGIEPISPSSSLPSETLSLEQLTTLNVDDGFDILDNLCLPALKNFSYISNNSPRLHRCMSLFTRSSCSLDVFDISSSILTSEDLIPLLKCIPTLRQLSLRWMPWLSPFFFQHLTHSSDNTSPLLPRLTSVFINVSEFDVIGFIQFVESRSYSPHIPSQASSIARLKNLTIESSSVADSDIFACLPWIYIQQLGDRHGLDIVIR